MRLKQLRGLPVIDPVTARKIGSVLDYQVDAAGGRLAALDVGRPGSADDADDHNQRVTADRIRRIGRSAVILTGSATDTPRMPVTVDERWIDTASLVGLEVMGDDGNGIGRLADAEFNQDSLDVDFYVLRSNVLLRLIPRRGRILPARIQSASRELLLLSTGTLKNLPPPTDDETKPSPPLPLKADDRLPTPSFEQAEGQAAVAQTS